MKIENSLLRLINKTENEEDLKDEVNVHKLAREKRKFSKLATSPNSRLERSNSVAMMIKVIFILFLYNDLY